jgi:H+/Cl- antiporter ClcA
MPEQKRREQGIKEYADGWITEREGTDVPAFLKLAFILIGLGCTAYFIVYMNGEVNDSDRGPLVQAFNRMTEGADPLMYVVAAMGLIFTIIVVRFAFSKFHD